MQGILNATDVRANFGGFIDSVVREKPQVVRRNRDYIIVASREQWKFFLSIYEFTFEYEQDEDGRFAGSIEQIDFIVADAETIEELRLELARQLMDYAYDYEKDFVRYFNAPNTRKHAPYILRVLLEDDIESVVKMLIG